MEFANPVTVFLMALVILFVLAQMAVSIIAIINAPKYKREQEMRERLDNAIQTQK